VVALTLAAVEGFLGAERAAVAALPSAVVGGFNAVSGLILIVAFPCIKRRMKLKWKNM
jgi:hypothetical protein